MDGVRPGQLVTSTAGRDAGEHYVVMEVTDGVYVVVANGTRRSVKNGKRKNRKHLLIHPAIHSELALAITHRRKINDDAVRAALEQLVYTELSGRGEEVS